MPTPLRRAAVAYTGTRLRAGLIRPITATHERHVLGQFCDFLGARHLRQIGRNDLLRWMGSLNGLAPGTRRNRFQIVRSFLEHLVNEGEIPRNPARTIPAPKVPKSRHRALAAPDARALLAACPDARARLIVILGLQLGLRRAEIAGLELGDIDWSARAVRVTGKGGHVRVVPLPQEAAAAIEHYLAGASVSGGGPLLRSERNPHEGISPATVGRIVSQVATDAAVKHRARDGVSTHALRHTAATDVHRATGDVLAVQNMLGHSSLATTQVYVRSMDVEGLRRAMEGRSYVA